MQVGTTKDQSLYNKPSAAVHPGALVAGILPQYNTTQTVQLRMLGQPVKGKLERMCDECFITESENC